MNALVFDADGTIADTDPVHAKAWLAALRAVTGRRGFDVRTYVEQCVLGEMNPKVFLARCVTAGEWPAVEHEKRRIYGELLAVDVSLAEGLHDLVSSARKSGVRIAVVSSSSRASVEALLTQVWQADQPDVVVCRTDGMPSKPAPDPYRKALDLLLLGPDRVVAFEDADVGVRSAKAAGLACVQVGSKRTVSADAWVEDLRGCSISMRDGQACLVM